MSGVLGFWGLSLQQVRRSQPWSFLFIGRSQGSLNSRINGEHLTVGIAFERARGGGGLEWKSHVPSRCFGVAAFYSREAGNRHLSEIFAFFHHHHTLVLEILGDYLEFLERDADLISDKLPPELWSRFGKERNARNEKKEWWESRGINLKGKEGISKEEVRKILDLGGLN